MEEIILDQLQLGEISPEARADMLDKISYVYAAKLVEACATKFSELELSRMEYLIEQNNLQTLQQEVTTHVSDPDELLTRVAADTVAELRENMQLISRKP